MLLSLWNNMHMIYPYEMTPIWIYPYEMVHMSLTLWDDGMRDYIKHWCRFEMKLRIRQFAIF